MKNTLTSCQTRHFSGCSQHILEFDHVEMKLSDPPFQRVFAADASCDSVAEVAVRPAISAGVRSLRTKSTKGFWRCQTRHFSGCSQPWH